MRQQLAALAVIFAGLPSANAALVYLNDTEVLDTNTNRVWLAPSATLGLGPVNTYTENGWKFGSIHDALAMIRGDGNLQQGDVSFDEAWRFYGDFWGIDPSEPEFGPRTHIVIGGYWPPDVVSDDGFAVFTFVDGVTVSSTAGITANLYQSTSEEGEPLWEWNIQGGPLGGMFPASGDWPDHRVWLYREAVIPLPATAWLFGGALGLLGIARRRAAA